MLEVRPLAIPEVLEIRPVRHGDDRGFFSEVWSRAALKDAGIDLEFVQDNHSFSAQPGVLRGLHFQRPPAGQAKLVRVTQGEIFDVAVDVRSGSPTYGRWVGITISAAAWNQILIPVGFAHGLLTLKPNTEVLYKVTSAYSSQHDRSIRHDDPALGIDWPVVATKVQLSRKDQDALALSETDTGFTYP